MHITAYSLSLSEWCSFHDKWTPNYCNKKPFLSESYQLEGLEEMNGTAKD